MKMIPGISKDYNKQSAAAYLVYEVVGSYYNRCSCKNSGELTRLYLHYAELPYVRRDRQTEKADFFMEKIKRTYLEPLSDLNCEVHFSRKEDDYIVRFYTGGFASVEGIVHENGSFQIVPLAA